MAKGIGKGINALFPEISEQKSETIEEREIDKCRQNRYQQRKVFEADVIDEIKESILQHGILQPLIVRKSIRGYEIVAGERRFRAGKEANLKTIPVIIKDLTDDQMMELALLENIQREDLSPIEEATAYNRLINE